MHRIEYVPMVSIMVVMYNPVSEKLFFTLDSLIGQKEIDFEIVITDDGSKENLFDVIEVYMEEHTFKNYKLVAHEKNRGTVANVYDGLKKCDGKYVKLLGPGDALIDDTALTKWVGHLIGSEKKWSFCNVINYRRNQGIVKKESLFAHPQMMKPYIREDTDGIRWNYLILNDLVTGVAMLCDKKILLKYIGKMVGRVIYADDNCYRLMNFYGEVASYYDCALVLYEVGEGISTSGNEEWSRRIQADWITTNEIMKEEACRGDEYQMKLLKNLNRINVTDNVVTKFFKMVTCKTGLKYVIKRIICPRMTQI